MQGSQIDNNSKKRRSQQSWGNVFQEPDQSIHSKELKITTKKKQKRNTLTDSKFNEITDKKSKLEILRAIGTTKYERCTDQWMSAWKSQDVFG